MKSTFRHADCARCYREYTYSYKGGRPRKYCFKCKPAKTLKRRQSLDAYAFEWGPLPYPWRAAKSTGNPTRFLGRHRLVLYATLDRFAFSLQIFGKWHGRNSMLPVEDLNVDRALTWAANRGQSILDSYDI